MSKPPFSHRHIPRESTATDTVPARVAVPFALSPDKGREISEMAATTLFGLPHVLRLAAHRILSNWFGYTALEPTAIRQIAFSPVLLPVWMVDVVVKGKALLSDVQVDLDGELLAERHQYGVDVAQKHRNTTLL